MNEEESGDEQDKGLPSFAGLEQGDMDEEDEDVDEAAAPFDGTCLPRQVRSRLRQAQS